ncbi:hypothetical protein PQR25_36765 [Paraburkholderia nemoris]|uniref:hypothetical protein n=1 Tax=Paraburkholderia nemoris TaxID=2793076 RepID=UPI0038BC770E
MAKTNHSSKTSRNHKSASPSVRPPQVKNFGIREISFCVPNSVMSDAHRQQIYDRFEGYSERYLPMSSDGETFSKRLSYQKHEDVRIVVECDPVAADYKYGFRATVQFDGFDFWNLVSASSWLSLLTYGFDLFKKIVITSVQMNFTFDIDRRTIIVDDSDDDTVNRLNLNPDSEFVSEPVDLADSEPKSESPEAEETEATCPQVCDPNQTAPAYAPQQMTRAESKRPSVPESSKVEEPLRMEFFVHPDTRLIVSNVRAIAKSFSNLRLCQVPPDISPFDDALGRQFVSDAVQHGVSSALSMLAPDKREVFSRAIAETPECTWWTRTQYENCVRAALELIDPLFHPLF